MKHKAAAREVDELEKDEKAKIMEADESDAEESEEGDAGEDSCDGSCDGSCEESCEGSDDVNEPSHYTMGKVQCIEAIESAVVGLVGIEAFLAGNAMKYLWRHEWKNGMEDLQKSHWYLCALMEARATREAEEAELDDSQAGEDDSEAGEDDSEAGEDDSEAGEDDNESDEPSGKKA